VFHKQKQTLFQPDSILDVNGKKQFAGSFGKDGENVYLRLVRPKKKRHIW